MIKSDGGSTSYYELPPKAKELNDLIEYKNMSFALGNIFKACYRFGEKDSADRLYDLRKIIFFANRLIALEESKREEKKCADVSKYQYYKDNYYQYYEDNYVDAQGEAAKASQKAYDSKWPEHNPARVKEDLLFKQGYQAGLKDGQYESQTYGYKV